MSFNNFLETSLYDSDIISHQGNSTTKQESSVRSDKTLEVPAPTETSHLPVIV